MLLFLLSCGSEWLIQMPTSAFCLCPKQIWKRTSITLRATPFNRFVMTTGMVKGQLDVASQQDQSPCFKEACCLDAIQ